MAFTFDNMMRNVQQDENLFYADQVGLDGSKYRIFNYRLGAFSTFRDNPNAIQMRGIMFRMDDEPELVCLPMEKFFNVNENAWTQDLDFSRAQHTFFKEDGSLISTWMGTDGQMHVKSKGSLHSDQVKGSQKLLGLFEDFSDQLRRVTAEDYTVDMEYVGPDNQIVLSYPWPALRVLGARHNATGEYVNYGTLQDWFGDNVVDDLDLTPEELENLPTWKEIEGVVVQFDKDYPVFRAKLKTQWYLDRHRLISDITNLNTLVDMILRDELDDALTVLDNHHEGVRKELMRVQTQVSKDYNHMVNQAYKFYEENKDLDRKEFALKGQSMFPAHIFHAAMNAYTGKKKPEDMIGDFLRKTARDRYKVDLSGIGVE